jgi:hypothetical protein
LIDLERTGLRTSVTPEKGIFNLSERPLFIDAFIDTSLFKPSVVKCSPRSINLTACLNNSKSAHLLVIKGYFSK